MKVLFTGGGTMGPVVPLLAVGEELKKREPNIDFFWIGTKRGPEKRVIQNYNIVFKSVYSGKLRRYFSLQNIVDILRITIGLFQSLYLLFKWKPNMIVSAGGYVAVPVIWAGWLLGIPAIIHQQDVRPGLANKLCARASKIITVCFYETAVKFKPNKTVVVGNPVRNSLKAHLNREVKEKFKKDFGLKSNLPLLLITTGGRGALSINKIIRSVVDDLTEFCQIVHLTGKDKGASFKNYKNDHYKKFDFVIDTTPLFKASDLVISRAGMGTLTEIAYLGKPSIIIPIPDSHQEENAKYFYEYNAIELIDQQNIDKTFLVRKIRELIKNDEKKNKLSQNIRKVIDWDAEKKIAKIICDLAK